MAVDYDWVGYAQKVIPSCYCFKLNFSGIVSQIVNRKFSNVLIMFF
jgi:hypothetical protein